MRSDETHSDFHADLVNLPDRHTAVNTTGYDDCPDEMVFPDEREKEIR